ncbi:MAG: fructosamine kinase [Micrococcales bacterium]|nr:MAG: fructosamine kinase [Micrococcales bacterium]
MQEFRKSSSGAPAGFFEIEAAGLRWLAQAQTAGGVRIARVLGVGPGWITLERLDSARATPDLAHQLGRELVCLHRAGADGFGAGPPGFEAGGPAGHGFIGHAPLPLVAAEDGPGRWGDFYGEHRVLPYVRAARDRGQFGAGQVQLFERVVARLADPADELAGPDEPVSRIHGDLWSGNVLWTPSGPALIDPAAHGGHRETDLAMFALFGLQYLDAVLAAYDEADPLADGWRERVALHQLHPLLVHVVLFGGGYAAQAVSAARRYA